MRIFLLFLVVLNLVYGLWQFYVPVSHDQKLPELPTGLESLRLLSELEPLDGKLDEPAVKLTNLQQSATVACFTLGPFRDKGLSEQAMAMLKGKVNKLEHRTREESEQQRYWVYIASLNNRAEAIAKSKELARKKIKDYYIIQTGSKNNGISLGHFKEKVHAYRRLENLKAMGFQVEIEPIYHTYTVHWLDYQLSGEQSVEKQILQDFQDDGVARLDRPCE